MKKRKWHTPEQIVKKLRDADVMLSSGNESAEVLQALEVSETTECLGGPLRSYRRAA